MNKYLLIAFLSLLQGIAIQVKGQTYAEFRHMNISSKKDTAIINNLIDAAMSYVLRKDVLKSDMDTAAMLANKAYKLAKKIRYTSGEGQYWYVFSNIYREQNEVEKGKRYAEKAINILSKTNDNNALGKSYLELANYSNAYSDQMLQKMELHEQAAGFFDKAGNFEMRGKTLKSLGEFYYMTGNYKSALIELQTAASCFKMANYPERQGVYDIMMTASTQVGDYEKALEYGLIALKTAEKVGDTSAQLYAILNHLGLTYTHLLRYDKAVPCFTSALSMAERTTDTFGIITIGKNLANSYANHHKPNEGIALLKRLDKQYTPLAFKSEIMLLNVYATIYIKMKKYNAAKPYIDKLVVICNSLDTLNPIQLQTYNPIISYYMATGQYKKAIQLCRYDISFSSMYNFINRLEVSYLTLATADSALGNYESALQNYKLYEIIEDSLYNQTKSWQIERLQIEYETEKKDKNIQVLTKEAFMQKTRAQQASMQRNVTFGGTSLLLAIVGLLFSRYRTKQRTNKKLEMQQKEISEKNASLQLLLNEKELLLREIHHRTKNNLQTVISLLNSQSKYLKSDAALSAIQDSKHRVQAMSLIHQKLYKSDSVSTIDIHDYISELVEYLKDCYNTGQRIRFQMDFVPIAVDVSQAVPLGLILNESITNAIKYAFPNGTGTISITLHHLTDAQYLLTIADNGIGIVQQNGNSSTNSLGMGLMRGLAEDIDGSFLLENNNGTVIKIYFRHDTTIHHVADTTVVLTNN